MDLHSDAKRSSREKLMLSAVSLFACNGYSGTSTKSIAEAAKLNELTLFRHFGTKQDLLRAIALELTNRESPLGIDANTHNIRHELQKAAVNEVSRVNIFGICALRLTIESSSNPEVNDVFKELGPVENLKHLSAVFATWQKQGKLLKTLSPELLAEAFSALTGNLLMTRMLFVNPENYLEDENLLSQMRSDVISLTNLFCDAVLIK
ncbi:TetR/AcrR family transcriptional regulator [Arcanobacterium ihumii]|uniref:TetR/AcrR family transcriptional regulator n=1 Tax=Arcanobacterium ihumii TaxID=2138162 RepID=UPI000F51D5C6|nr:TetR/AcrR family transcriptional regulator [Arcanobacterium ihumii]